jgi:mannitol/fructose-specific phosphotransferase system IIA component (Ntr-type)
MDETDGMSLRDAAHFLNLSTQEVVRLVENGRLPGVKRTGRWEFNRRALLDHFEQEMGSLPPERLAAVERSLSVSDSGAFSAFPKELLLAPLICPAGISLNLPARTRASALAELVALAGKTELVWDAPALLDSIRRREDVCSTALEHGVAVPHPRRAPEYCLAESLVVFGRTGAGVPFGALDGRTTDLFFLVCCTDERTHLQVLARLCRILRNDGVLDALRAASSAEGVLQIMRDAETADLRDRP